MPDEMLDRAEAFVREAVVTPQQWRLLEPAFRDLRQQLQRDGIDSDALYCVCVPRLVFSAVTGDEGKAIPLAAALLLLHLGTELLDDVMDGDVLPAWEGFSPSEISLAAATLYAALTPLALAAVDAEPVTALALQCMVARGLLRMSAGQRADLALTGSDTATSADVEDSIAGKSGEAVSMYAALAAELGGAAESVIADYAAMGRFLGTAAQIRSECIELFLTPVSRDLASGSRTLPIALHLERLAGQEREEFLGLLDQARSDSLAQKAVRQRLMEGGIVRACAMLVAIYSQRARAALGRAGPPEPAATALHRLIESTSLYQNGHRQNGHRAKSDAPVDPEWHAPEPVEERPLSVSGAATRSLDVTSTTAIKEV